MNAKPVWLMCLLALGACGEVRSEAGGNNAAASKAVTPRPGKYRVEFVREIMAPGTPSQPMLDVETQCFSAEDMKDLESIFVPVTGRCRDRQAEIGEGEVSARMLCDFPEAGIMDVGFDVRGTYDEESADLTGDATLPEGTLRETRTFRREGDC